MAHGLNDASSLIKTVMFTNISNIFIWLKRFLQVFFPFGGWRITWVGLFQVSSCADNMAIHCFNIGLES